MEQNKLIVEEDPGGPVKAINQPLVVGDRQRRGRPRQRQPVKAINQPLVVGGSCWECGYDVVAASNKEDETAVCAECGALHFTAVTDNGYLVVRRSPTGEVIIEPVMRLIKAVYEAIPQELVF